MTVCCYSDNNNILPKEKGAIEALVCNIFKNNPHYKLQFEGIDNYLPSAQARRECKRTQMDI